MATYDEWAARYRQKFAPYEVATEEREQVMAEGEVGKYPGDNPDAFLKSGRQAFSKLKTDRLALTEQVKKARVKEQELHPYPKLERAFDSVIGRVPSFLSPDIPTPETAFQPAAKTSTPAPIQTPAQPTQPMQPLSVPGSRFQGEDGEIIDTKNREIISQEQFNALSTPQERTALGQPAEVPVPDDGFVLEVPEVHVTAERPPVVAPTQSRTTSEAIVDATNNYFQGLADIPAGALKSIAIASKELDALMPDMLKNPQDVEDRFTYKLGKSIEQLAKKMFPTDPAHQQDFMLGVLPRAFGSMTGFIAGGVAGMALKAPGTAASVLGAGVQGADQYEEAGQFKADEATKRKAFLFGSVVGATEGLPIAAMLKRYDTLTGGVMMKTLKQGGVTAAQEAIQEWGQQVGSNVIAQQLYDEHRSFFENAGVSAGAGGTVGAVTGLVTGLLQGRKTRKQQQQKELASESPFAGEAPAPAPVAQPTPEETVSAIPPELAIQQPAAPFLIRKPMQPVTPAAAGPQPLEQPLPPAPELESLPATTAPSQRDLAPEPEAAPFYSVNDPNLTAEQAYVKAMNDPRNADFFKRPDVEILDGPDTGPFAQVPYRQPVDITPTPDLALPPVEPQAPSVPGDPLTGDMREALDAPLEESPVDRAPIDTGPALETIDRMYRQILDDTKATHHLKRENKEAWAIVKRVDQTMKAGLKEGLEYEQAVQRVDSKDLEALGQILGGKQVVQEVEPSVPTPEEAVSEASQTLADFEDPTSAISEEEKGEQRKKVAAIEQREVPTPDTAIESSAHEAATSPTNPLPEPTEAQKEAGNYRKGHVRIAGLDISIENPQGSMRSGAGKDGKPWSQEMQSHYGYIKGTVGKDKDHLDVFVDPGTTEDFDGPIYVIDQIDPTTGSFDEHKVILGARTLEAAKQIYKRNYSKDWKGMGEVNVIPNQDFFKKWLKSGQTTKPFQNYMNTVPTPEEAVAKEQTPDVPSLEAPVAKERKPDPMVGELQPGELSFDEFLQQSRFYRSGKDKRVEVPGGERVILKPESTATNFRENSRKFLKGVYGNYIAKLRKDKSAAPDTKKPPSPDAVLTAPQQAADQSKPEITPDAVQASSKSEPITLDQVAAPDQAIAAQASVGAEEAITPEGIGILPDVQSSWTKTPKKEQYAGPYKGFASTSKGGFLSVHDYGATGEEARNNARRLLAEKLKKREEQRKSRESSSSTPETETTKDMRDRIAAEKAAFKANPGKINRAEYDTRNKMFGDALSKMNQTVDMDEATKERAKGTDYKDVEGTSLEPAPAVTPKANVPTPDTVSIKEAEQTSFADVAPANQITLPTDLKSEQELRAMQYDRIPEGTMVSMKAIRASTGEYVTIQADARTALRDLDAAEAKYRKLLECLES